MVKEEFVRLNLPIDEIELGKVIVSTFLSKEKIDEVRKMLDDNGFELIVIKRVRLSIGSRRWLLKKSIIRPMALNLSIPPIFSRTNWGTITLISALIPNDFFELLNLSPILQMLLILVVSIPLYICATGSIPLAAILILKGISPGAAFVLLMAGPATNAATITMIGKVLGKKSLFTYLFTIIAGALGFALIIDYVLPLQWFTLLPGLHTGHHHIESLNWWQITSGIVLPALIINGYVQRYLKSRTDDVVQLKNSTMEIKTIKVEGMTCNHCKANVENNLKTLSFIASASVNLGDKTVTLKGDHIELQKVKDAIEALGYKVVDSVAQDRF